MKIEINLLYFFYLKGMYWGLIIDNDSNLNAISVPFFQTECDSMTVKN